MLGKSEIIALVNSTNNEITAFARFLSDSVYRASIYDVIVANKYRGSGYGRILLEAMTNDERLKNIERVELYCQDKNVQFYEKFGFRKVPEGTNFMRRTPG